ncbi:carboxypeptidase-like regulatory domain-containing protein [Nitrosovibrio sp. Nv6]|uniref:carboxypeptidase-like regulatory domain-containing protein n=1 Tax=Nitrosovibrio sp. Nv6 TaxID=1855340 RepID=UPI0008D0D8B8|nr:carboxypeptidase-like regulatory domain-containing protein [Nitrosovibrio sp. Nv6]SEO46411.1 hypothetical protein SAMN05216316_0273 [Nitrosovibrio sp. Nv6]
MRATIQFSHPDKKFAILTKLLNIIKGIKNLHQHILADGILLERLDASDIEKLKTALAGPNYSKCVISDNSIRVIIIGGELRALFGLVIPIPGRQDDFARIFWERGFTLEHLTPGQAEAIRNQLDAIAAVTITPDIPQTRIYTVSGQVSQDDGTPLSTRGFTVRAFDSLSVNSLVLCGSTATLQADGFYRIDYAWRSNGRKGPDLLVRVFDPEGNVVAETKKSSAAIQEFLDMTAEGLCIVRGIIRYADGAPLPDVVVRAFDRDMRAEALLGNTVTDAEGFYEITYSVGQFQAKKAQADLVMRVFRQGEGEEEIAVSDIVFDASLQQAIDMEIESRKFPGPSEYEQYLAALKPFIVGEPIHELTDEDLSFLNGKTNIPLEQLSHLRVDAQWSFQYGLEPGMAYGLFSQGLPANLRRLLTEKRAGLHEALRVSLVHNVVPAGLAGQIDEVLERLLSLTDSPVVELDRKVK